jgi:outer membrane murein-binding lipoprotein Lpp
LTLILGAVVLGQIGGSSKEQYERMTKEIASLNRTIPSLGDQVAQTGGRAEALSDEQEDANQIILPGTPEEVEERLNLRDKRDKLRESAKTLEDRVSGLNKQLQGLQPGAEKGSLRLVPEQQGRGLGKGLKPNYVECRADGLLLYPEKMSISMSEIGNDLFGAYVDRVRSRTDQCIVLLIRPNGVPAFDAVERQFDSRGLKRYGYVPLPTTDGEIQFYRDDGNR